MGIIHPLKDLVREMNDPVRRIQILFLLQIDVKRLCDINLLDVIMFSVSIRLSFLLVCTWDALLGLHCS